MSSPLREITTTSPAPSFRRMYWTERLAPPEPSTRHLRPRMRTRLFHTMASKPAASVLSPRREPSSCLRTVFTLPMAAAAEVRSSQMSIRVFL